MDGLFHLLSKLKENSSSEPTRVSFSFKGPLGTKTFAVSKPIAKGLVDLLAGYASKRERKN